MLLFRACPRCRQGVIEPNSDHYGLYLMCLNCGFMTDLRPGEYAWTALLRAGRSLQTSDSIDSRQIPA